ncbi:ABC transporter ATP-binding protein [uncultured Methylobacterium sp.]|jgi:NitT/TauT family transport system ATP-binding protein|uniref:ABC transporter ATP-binding protein n=1 Tax=uncultured Methylobacterium sp. TaxID=157278 RepID=UPI00260A876F|nr:ABC transporter ATP-binding protein [uncultured Methylobacterium sp.]
MSASPARGGLSFSRVSVAYDTPRGPVPALSEVSLTVAPGEFVAVVGPSGCGKSTLLKLAAGLLAPSSGTVAAGGAPVAGPGADRGVIFQDYAVFPWLTVEQNIGFGLTLSANRAEAREREARVAHYLDRMGLAEFRHALPKTLSGGMKQRVALARAYVVRPGTLLMDEPFGALDSQTRLAMHDLLLGVLRQEGTAGLLITHSVEEALYLASRVVVLSARPGRIRAVIEVPFGRERDHALLASPDLARLKGEITELVMDEYRRQTALDRRPAA